MVSESFKRTCIDIMKDAEWDKDLLNGLIYLSKKAVLENKPIYDVMLECYNKYERQESSLK